MFFYQLKFGTHLVSSSFKSLLIKKKGAIIMKKQFQLLALLMLSAMATLAFPFGNSSLELSVSEFGNYEFEINGRTYASSTSSINIDGLIPGSYDVRIYKNHQVGFGRYKHFQRVLVYNKKMNIPHNTSVVARFDRFGMNVQEFRSHHSYNNTCGDVRSGFNGYRTNNRNVHHHDNRRGGLHTRAIAMHQEDFNHLMLSLRDASFDKTKVQIAESAISRNRMSTEQIAQIMRILSFDSHRLRIAKSAYNNCIDQQNYHLLTREFSFDSSSRSLLNYIH